MAYPKRKGKQQAKRQFKNKGRKTGRRAMTKQAVANLIDKKLDARIEDKYLLDVNYTSLRTGDADNDSTHFGYLRDITPSIPKGTDENNRVGDNVFMKFMSIQTVLKGHNFAAGVTLAETNALNLFPAGIPVDCHLFRIISGEIPTVADMSATYRREGLWPQDVVQDDDEIKQKLKIQKIKSFRLKAQYRTIFGNQEDTSTGTPVVDCVAYSVPQMTFHTENVSIKQKWLINDTTNFPMKYSYYLYVDYKPQAWRQHYDTQLLSMPDLDIRFRWVYEDA